MRVRPAAEGNVEFFGHRGRENGGSGEGARALNSYRFCFTGLYRDFLPWINGMKAGNGDFL